MSKDLLEQEYPVIRKMYLLTVEYSKRVQKFPRDGRFILGDRILVNCYDILEGLLEARYIIAKQKVLKEQNIRLEKLRFQTRLCKDMKYITARQYGYLSELIDETGKMLGGWIKSIR